MFSFGQKSSKIFQKELLGRPFWRFAGVPRAQNLQKYAIRRDLCQIFEDFCPYISSGGQHDWVVTCHTLFTLFCSTSHFYIYATQENLFFSLQVDFDLKGGWVWANYSEQPNNPHHILWPQKYRRPSREKISREIFSREGLPEKFLTWDFFTRRRARKIPAYEVEL